MIVSKEQPEKVSVSQGSLEIKHNFEAFEVHLFGTGSSYTNCLSCMESLPLLFINPGLNTRVILWPDLHTVLKVIPITSLDIWKWGTQFSQREREEYGFQIFPSKIPLDLLTPLQTHLPIIPLVYFWFTRSSRRSRQTKVSYQPAQLHIINRHL